jgi:uncharacterized protein (TIGR03435 family)
MLTVKSIMKMGLMIAIIPLALAQMAHFEVASIKPSLPGGRGYSIIPSAGGRLNMKNMTLKRMLSAAYHVQDFQISGGPKWLETDPYDVLAKAEGNQNLTERQLLDLVKPLLADQFQVAFHWEAKQLPRYSLVVGKGGSKLKEVPADGEPQLNIRARKLITGHRAPLSQFTEVLSWVMGRVVVDDTGLKNVYDFKLEWSPDELQLTEPGATRPTDGSGNSIFEAIHEQMGLKLEPQKGPVQVLVVDRAEKATEN